MIAYDRMMLKVEKSNDDGCWLFRGALDQNGHGNVRIFRNGKWTCTKAHRVAFEESYGPVPEGKVVRHRCDVRACVNPGHLVAGTQKENVADMLQRGRAWFQQKVTEVLIDADCPF